MAEQTPDSAAKKARLKKIILRAVGAAVLFLVVLTAAVSFMLPSIVESKAKAFFADNFNRKLVIRKMDLSLLSLTFKMEGVSLSEADKPDEVFASFDEFYVDLDASTLTSFDPVVREIRLKKPFLRLARIEERRSNVRDFVLYIRNLPKTEKKDGEKTLFSINNIQISDGEIHVDDNFRDKHLVISEMNINIPFIANKATDIPLNTPLAISAKLNKDKIELAGKSRTGPKYGKKTGRLALTLEKFDLPTYIDYLPFDPGFKLKSGKLSIDMNVIFAKRENDRRPIYMEGEITLDAFRLAEKDGKDLVNLPELKLEIARSDVAAGELNIERIGFLNPEFHIDRDASGAWSHERFLSNLNFPKKKANPEDEAKKAEEAKAKKRSLAVNLKSLAFKNARVYFADQLTGLKLNDARFSTDISAAWTRSPDGDQTLKAGGTVTLSNVQLSDLKNTGIFKVSEIGIELGDCDIFGRKFALNRIRVKAPEAMLERDGEGIWNFERMMKAGALSSKAAPDEEKADEKTDAKAAEKTEQAALIASLGEFSVEGAKMQFTDHLPGSPIVLLAKDFGLKVENASFNAADNSVLVEKVTASGARFKIVHTLPEILDRYMKSGGKEEAAKAAAEAAVKDAADKSGFHFRVAQAGIKDWQIYFVNENAPDPATKTTRLVLNDITVKDVSDDMSRPMPFSMSSQINDQGSSLIKGCVTVSPFKADLDVDIRSLDIRFVQPYIDNYVNISLKRADLSVKGVFNAEQGGDGQIKGTFKGGAGIANMSAVDQMTGRSILSWKDFAFENIDAALSPMSVRIGTARIEKSAARLILSSDGHLNLQDILRSRAGGKKSLAEGDSEDGLPAAAAKKEEKAPEAKKPAGAHDSRYAGAHERRHPGKAGGKPRTAEAQLPPKKEPAVPVVVDKFIIADGSVRFTDNFIKPSYTANLLNLEGIIENISNDASTQSKMALRGRVNGAPLTVTGYINPLAESLTMNVKAQVKGMELAQFSSYTGKYLGYGIHKGKLSYTASYKIEKGLLKAENSLVLDQLTLGEKVESEDAQDLSIELALSLLKDDDGVINISLPISGSLSDPQFSLSDVIGTVIRNALKKVITAPFAFLFSSSENEKTLSGMPFEAGKISLSDANTERLGKIAKGLAKYPKVKLEITGLYDEEADRDGIGAFMLKRRIQALKQKKTGKMSFEEVEISDEEYPSLVKEIYDNEKFEKPKQLMFFEKSVPVEEMEKLLRTHFASRLDSMVFLANMRAEAVKTWLVMTGGMDEERIYILAGKKGEPATFTKQDGTEVTVPAHRVDLNLRSKK